MKVLVIGGGGREHASVKKLKQSPEVTELYVLPGNGGMEEDAICVPGSATDISGMVAFAVERGIEFCVVTPDDPLALGAVDALVARGIPCFGPRANAAAIESSKVFAKNLMKRYNIPTAEYRVFTRAEEALRYLDSAPLPTVIKADGLALGKGVVIANTREEAQAAVRSMMEEKVFGESGSRIIVEEFLTGPEVSVLAFTDGKTIRPMVSSMDHKRALDGDKGLNTGGMGTIAPNPYYTDEVAGVCMERIFLPTVRAMAQEGRPFSGCLYFGLMLTGDGPKVIEYNCRFGDPETQVVLPLLQSDLFQIMRHCADGTLEQADVRFSSRAACCVILASKGYPGKYEKGFALPLPEKPDGDVQVFVAGAKRENGRLVTAGGRVLGVTATADNLKAAVEKAYEKVESVWFENAYCRRDVGAKALAAYNAGRNA